MTDYYVEEVRPHLGGYIIGGDPATYYPELWDWLVRDYGIESVLDVGCGEGHAIAYFHDTLGIRAQGIDGVDQDNMFIWEHDYTHGPLVPADMSFRDYDLIWSCEFVEHVREEYIPNFLATFRAGKLVLMTHAEPGQNGHHHVNCQPASYWMGAMEAAGFRFDGPLTAKTRELAAQNKNPINHFARSGLAFIRRWPDDFKGFGSNVQPKGRA